MRSAGDPEMSRLRTGKLIAPAATMLAIALLAACSSGAGSSAPPTAKPTATSVATTPLPAPSTVSVLPVSNCPTRFATPQQLPWHPDHEAVFMPAPLVGSFWLYSNGMVTVMAPQHWICSASVTADGSMSMSVLPAGSVSPTNPDTDYTSVVVSTDNTGHNFGASLACGYFPKSAAAQLGQLCDHPPRDTLLKPLTRDIVSFTHGPTSGIVVYPQIANGAASVNVAKVSCDAGALCTEVIGDALTRFAPAYTPPAP